MEPEDVAQALLAERMALTGYLRALVAGRSAADDLFQEVTVRAVREAGRFADAAHLRRWFHKVAKHRAIDHLRRVENRDRVLAADVVDLLGAEASDAGPGAVTGERCDALERCLGSLSPKCREVIELRYGEGLPGLEVAARLGRKPDTIYKMLARSYAQLRRCIEARLARAAGGGGDR